MSAYSSVQACLLVTIVLVWEVSLAFSDQNPLLSLHLAAKRTSSISGSLGRIRGGETSVVVNGRFSNSQHPIQQGATSRFRKMDSQQKSHTQQGLAASADNDDSARAGRLEELKQREAELAAQLAAVRLEKLSTLRSRPLTIGVVGFGRFGQFIARTFAKHGRVVVTSRSDYTEIARGMGVTYVPLDDPEAFLAQNLDVIVFCVSILSFESTLQSFVPYLREDLERRRQLQMLYQPSAIRTSIAEGGDGAAGNNPILRGPLIVDVLSVKEHARQVMLDLLPVECDILCTHPMFGPDSGKDGWNNLNFVYEKTRVDKVILDPKGQGSSSESFIDSAGHRHSVHEDSEAHVEGVDRIERFLSIWEEEGCRMVPMSCRDHDAYAANSQFITHLMGRILGAQGLAETPIDTSGFQSVLKLVDSTTADSFELFYGLYKFNQNSLDTIHHLQAAMNDVVARLREKEQVEQEKKQNGNTTNSQQQRHAP